ncbi:MAG TPA: hypothetical protein VMH47_07610 [Gaiellaceae bacterium]|nr:hypothetical protein [Gaiellaceae bacterium]
MAFAVDRRDPPAIEVRVNFGVFAGREATPAEIERLAELLLDEVGEVTVIAEERHLLDANAEASLHQVRIEVSADLAPAQPAARAELERRIVERADYWARVCVADRHAELTDGA